MVAPRITISLIDPGAAARPVNIDQIPVYVGIATGGSTSEVKTFARVDLLKTEYTRGHLVDVAAHHLGLGNSQVKTLRVAATTPGANTTPVESGLTFTGTPITGTPVQFLNLRIEVLVSALISSGNCVVKYSLDNFSIPNVVETYSDPINVPASGILPLADTGLSANLTTAQTPAVGAFATLTTDPGEYNGAAIASSADVIRLPQTGPFTFVCWAGSVSLASEANTLALAIETELLEFFNAAQFVGAMVDGGREVAATLITAITGTAIEPPFLSMGYGAVYVSNPSFAIARARLGLRQHEIASALVSTLAVSTDPGRTANGALKRVVGTDYDAAVQGSTLHDARVATVRNWKPASEGLFVQRQRLLSSSVSNFTSWQHAAVMLVALSATHRVAFLMILDLFRKLATGTLDPRDAKDIEGAINAELSRVLLQPTNVKGTQGHVSATSATVSLTELLPKVSITVKVRPFGYAEDLAFTLQYADEV